MKTIGFPLVAVIDGEPRASTDIIAKGMRQSHANVIRLVRRYSNRLNELGRVSFENQSFATKGGIQSREVALLNESQSALLISLMRNSDKVVDFKVALVRDFYQMRDRLRDTQQSLYQQLQALVAEEVSSQVRASFGSRLMNDRKRSIPGFRERRQRLEAEIQPSLQLH